MITSKTIYNQPRHMATITSGEAGPTDVIEVSGLPSCLPHCFASIRFFDGTPDPAVPTGGTLTVLVQTQGHNFEAPPENVIDATDATTVTWSANTEAVRVTPGSLTGVTTWQLILTFNLS